MTDFQTRFSALFSPATLKTLGVGALGGLAAFFVTEPFGNDKDPAGFLEALWDTALWSGAIGVVLGAILLAYDNFNSLRGQWHRDLLPAIPTFGILGMLGGAAGQFFYSLLQTPSLDAVMRAGGWALMGAGIGLGIGTLRRDPVQASRGAWGGLLGGFLGGFLFNGLALLSDAGGGTLSRLVGLTLTGAAIAFGRLFVQEALKTAWLLGISTGPYEGKEAPLTKNRVSVGRDASNDIALFRDESVPPHLGELVFENGNWKWSGQSAKIDGVATQNAILKPDSVIEFGAAKFRFLDRSRHDTALSGTSPQVAPAPVRLRLRPLAPEAQWPILELPDAQNEAAIGRAPTCDFVLSAATVSSQHARLFRNSAGLQVRDDHSTNGTSINGQKIAPAIPITLREGDRVKFGEVEYSVETGA
ncbi:MAG: FHA domain-containing protein [Armatimonadetes bacterium]|nr:FHA domain-containing protein [Armatimonadota bacterium]